MRFAFAPRASTMAALLLCVVARDNTAHAKGIMHVMGDRIASVEGKLRLLEGLIAEVYCEKLGRDDATQTGAWCLREAGQYGGQPIAEAHYMDAGIGPLLGRVFHNHSVLDLGAGSGQYGLYFASADASIEYTGVDGALNVERFTSGRVQWADLSSPTAFPEGQHDFVMSLEVGEHLPPRFESTFLANIDNNNVCGAALSWATVGQMGHGHVNCRDNDYVIAKMRAMGYEYDAQISNSGRESAEMEWFKSTFMFFRRTSAQNIERCKI